MFVEILITLLCIMIFTLTVLKTKDILHPAVILSFVFSIDFAFYLFMKIFTKSTYSLDINVLYFAVGLLIFFIGTIIGSKNTVFPISILIDNDDKKITAVNILLVIIEYIILLMMIIDIIKTARITTISLYSIMTAAKKGLYLEKYVFKLFRTISFSLSFVAVFEILSNSIKNKGKVLLYFQIINSICFMMLNTSRTVWFMFFIPIMFIIIYSKYKDIKEFIKIFLILFVLFFVMTVIVTFLREQSPTLYELRSYLCSGVVQFSEWMKVPSERLNGQYTFRVFFAVLNRLGLYSKKIYWIDTSYLNLLKFDWVVGNVYTFYHGFAQDFGPIYALFIQLLVGIFHGFIYYMGRKTKLSFFIVLNAIFMFPLILQFYCEQYAALVSMWIQTVMVLFVALNTNVLYKKLGTNKFIKE